MPANQGDGVQWINIRDFTPGIFDNPGAQYAPGTAQRANTYRCIANRNGALVALPARTEPFSLPFETSSSATPIAVNGLYVPPISFLPSTLPFQPNQFPEHEVMIGTEWIQGTLNHRLYRVRRYESPGTAFDLIHSEGLTAPAAWKPSGMAFATTRSNRPDFTVPGCPVVAAMWQYILTFPDDQNQSSNTPYVIFTSSSGRIFLGMCAHQAKLVVQEASSYNQGVNSITFMGESVIWSGYNDVSTANWWGAGRTNPATSAPSQPAVFIPEYPSGLAFLISMSANELFGVKVSGGLFVTGDLDVNAVATSLPMVTGAELLQTPVATNSGVVYGSRTSGVWVWSHGDTSQLLSPGLVPDFWVITPGSDFDDFGGVTYQFSRCDDWVLVPNNWIYDLQLQSWWRLEDPSVLQIRYFSAMSHFIYGSESFYNSSSVNPVHEWVWENKSQTYSWQSQPLWETIDTLVDMREIALRVSGTGTVKVTASGETNSSFVTFTNLSSTVPILVRQPIRVQDSNIAIRIESTGQTTTDPAPTVWECNVGYYETQREAIHN